MSNVFQCDNCGCYDARGRYLDNGYLCQFCLEKKNIKVEMIKCSGCGRTIQWDSSMDEDLLVSFVCDDCAYDMPQMSDLEFMY